MGILRKSLLISTGGLAPVKANSKKQRTAKAAEKQVRIQKQMLREQRSAAARATHTPAKITPTLSADLQQLGNLHDKGVLTDDEFAAAKKRALETR